MNTGSNDCCNDEAIARILQAELEAIDEQERRDAAVAAAKERSPFADAIAARTTSKRKTYFARLSNGTQTSREHASKPKSEAPWTKTALHAKTTSIVTKKQTSSFREVEDEAFALQTVQNDIERIRTSAADPITDELILQTQKLALSNGSSDPSINSLISPQPKWHPVDSLSNGNNQNSDPFQFSLDSENMPSLTQSFNSSDGFPLSTPTILGIINNGAVTSESEASRRYYERFQQASTSADTVAADGLVIHPRIVTSTSPPISPSPPASYGSYSLETVRRLHFAVDSSVMPPPDYLELSGCTKTNGDSASAKLLLNGKRNGSRVPDGYDPKIASAAYQEIYDVYRQEALRKRSEALICQRSSVGKHPAASAVQRQRADRMRADAAEEDKKAGWAIVYSNNRGRNADVIDLHGLHQADLPHILPHIVRQKQEQLKPGTRLALIVGVGNNSRTRKCVVRARVMEFFKLNKMRFDESPNSGTLFVPMPNVLPKLDADLSSFGSYEDVD